MGLRTWAWPSCEGLHLGTKTSAGPSVARLGLNKSLLITGQPPPEPQPEEQQSTEAIPVSLSSAGVSVLSLPGASRQTMVLRSLALQPQTWAQPFLTCPHL